MDRLFRWAGLLATGLLCASTEASFYRVTGTADNTDSATHGGAGTLGNPFLMSSLRGAISAANASVGTADTILLPAGTYTLTIIGNEEQANATGDLDILDDLTIIGSDGNNNADPALTIIKGGAGWDDKIIDINPNNNLLLHVTIEAVTIRDGNNTGASDYYGGGINMFGRPNLTGAGAAGTLTIDNCIITSNHVLNGGNEGGGGLLAEQVNTFISNSTISNNSSSNDDGGGISCPGINENFSLTRTTVSGNSAGAGFGGGGLAVRRLGLGALSAGGTVSIALATFSSNHAGGRGGGLQFTLQSGGNAVSTIFTVQDSTISGNVAGDTSLGSGTAEGAGFYYAGDTTPNSANVVLNRNNIINNSLDAASVNKRGGGGVAVGSGNATFNFCRFAGNALNGAPSGANQGSGLHKDNNAGTVNLVDDWWGSNSGPTGAGNTAVVSGSGSSVGVINITSWLVLNNTPNSASDTIGGSDLLTASFLIDNTSTSVGSANLTFLNGVAITFNNATFGTLSGASTSIASGTATATFTANAAGFGTAQATVDGVAVTANISIPTSVLSISRGSVSPSDLASVTWTVTFADAVSGVNAANFSLVNTGLAGTPAISSVVAVGASPATSWTVTASTGSGNGTLGLNMVSAAGLSAPVNNLTFTGEVYTIDLVPPTASIISQPPNPSNSSSATFAFTGSDNVTPANQLIFEVSLDGGAFATATSPISFTGLANGSHSFQVEAIDSAGNVSTPGSYTWTIDTTPPTINIGVPSISTTKAGPVAYTITYADANFNASTLAATDITLNKTGSANGNVAISGSGTTRTVTISSIVGDGTLGITVGAGTASDTAGNLAPASGASATFTVEHRADDCVELAIFERDQGWAGDLHGNVRGRKFQ